MLCCNENKLNEITQEMPVEVATFFDKTTFTFTHIVYDSTSREAAIIDPVLDFEPFSVSTSSSNADKLLAFVEENQLIVRWLLETHVHADHLSAACYLKNQTGAESVIGSGISQVQETFNQIYNLQGDAAGTRSHFDHLLADGDSLPLGDQQILCLHTPGHTPACCTYVIDNKAFVGDTLFMPDFGSARCDFPGGDAEELYDSIQKILALGDDTQLYMCHDYMPGGRELAWQCTNEEQKRDNIHIGQNTSKQDFVKMRQQRDAELAIPKLLLASLQFNIRGGQEPAAENNGGHYLKLPLNLFGQK